MLFFESHASYCMNTLDYTTLTPPPLLLGDDDEDTNDTWGRKGQCFLLTSDTNDCSNLEDHLRSCLFLRFVLADHFDPDALCFSRSPWLRLSASPLLSQAAN